ncbi:MAG: dihydroneopterin aldolase [Lentisphaeria bacterium]|nr:dihydroneopterin aldolase [Lentisphaeria bacterium]
MKKDRILIRDLATEAVIGTLPEERLAAQPLILNLEIVTDFRAAGASDDLLDAVDYSQIERTVDKLVRQSQYFLLESLGEAICRAILETPGVDSVTLRIDKPGAARIARTIGIEMERSR